MCGIALLVSGVRLGSPSREPNGQHLVFSVEGLKSALLRRGPDSVGSTKLLLKVSGSGEERVIGTCIESEVDGDIGGRKHCFLGEMHFLGATLQLRGVEPVLQPFVDESGNILVYNGEIFDGIPMGRDCNDGKVLLQYLGGCCACNSHELSASCPVSKDEKSSVPEVLSRIKGPWAAIYWQDCSKTLWFGKDAFGRRSLLVHWPSVQDPRFLLSSVSPTPSIEHSSAADFELENGLNQLNFWEELPCGIHSINIDASSSDGHLVGGIKKHGWSNSMLNELIQWERHHIEPIDDGENHDIQSAFVRKEPCLSGSPKSSVSRSAEIVLTALRDSVMRRTSLHTFFQGVTCDGKKQQAVPVAVLFSGGVDSMILAALLDQCLDPHYEVDLLNVSFDGPSAPDRISARMGVKELTRISHSRRWRLVEIDADLSSLTSEMKHVMSLIYPANTYMDLNIGTALWLAANGNGWVYEEKQDDNEEPLQRHKYKSPARILLIGSGADEQCAGYGRHKTKYKQGGWVRLHEEMRLDMQRIWKRNLGRDDRCISDIGREARFPFLDEDVIRVLLNIPLWEIANLEEASGTGDKKILREVARLLGLSEASILPKRAIQFGSRIARESNRKNFGSNRAANQANAGSVTIRMQ